MHRRALIIVMGVLTASIMSSAESRSVKDRFVNFVEDEVSEFSTPPAQPKLFAANTSYTLCFVPDGPACERLLIDSIDNTRKSLLIQAYSFTSAPIAGAVVKAHKRGVDVRVILDKSQISERYTSATFLKNAGIPVVVDTEPAIAHNKIMIFDQQAVFTGSFNFSKSAQARNAENGMVIRGDAAVVKAYTENWAIRHGKSSTY